MKIVSVLLGILVVAGIVFAAIRLAPTSGTVPEGASEMMDGPRDGADDAMIKEDVNKEEGMMQQADADADAEQGDAMMEKDDEAMMKDDAAEDEEAMKKAGSYEAYAPEKLARAADGDAVLFFRASWCPTCRALDADIRANLSDIPSGLTILDVDYDNSSALKQKYGVTYQHTLVQVDAEGNQIAKWTGSPTLAAFVTNVK